jgi:ABC-type uncharacterized transport system ATPase component
VQVDIDLPQIAVIGSQSAGKSSLIESISGITLLVRAERVPGELLSTIPHLSRIKQVPNRVPPLAFRTALEMYGLASSYQRRRNEPFGEPIFENAKSEVENRIRGAQLAILNPSRPAKDCLTASENG